MRKRVTCCLLLALMFLVHAAARAEISDEGPK